MVDIKTSLAEIGVVSPSITVNDLVLDSRLVNSGDVFIAIKGFELDGGKFIASALNKGAVLVLADSECLIDKNINHLSKIIKINKLNQKLAKLSAHFYGKPSEQLQLIGVTGTNGKSTITSMIASLVSSCEIKSAVIGTLGWGQPDALTPLDNTTPSTIALQQMLSNLKQKNTDLVAMEVSSHGLTQGRVDECKFKAAVFSNLSRDHLDYHGDMAQYANAKLQLFTEHSPVLNVFNLDDPITTQWLNKYDFKNRILFGYGQNALTNNKYVLFNSVECTSEGVKAKFITSWDQGNLGYEINCPIFGEFNLYNLAAALSVVLGLGYPIKQVFEAANHLEPIAGRMQPFYSLHNKPTCIVDYAHTPEALALALKALQSHVPGGITCVFGCGGDRDKGKRALMAKAAQRYANKIIVTSDNPRTENPDDIISDVLKGFTDQKNVQVEVERAKAIALAISQATQNEVVLIAGKGHEDYQIIGDKIINFCDRAWVKQLLEGGC
ncbi:UDP-N-acetylmuramoyl-L-alanyl-D-glutamate--2,6-diaminopimelate ligase [Pseudoalteromonas denitrificans]|uniref:UDP-N-acetylmuramoyl-L-alanyl-D-glutamate--2,6-diaminopimelate ligase n=1 Tax=Pseudoalteromonas denitrificans DSM 6059 TaxID=1123010 RepID=A0A1I1QM51_9GAMM|nr:UDP-N-acetylmuramoyl-L-alanyl-D-glutamate--2,6-diaminopimelate ligase [Pseudoalteromonas denitrificans]SFD23105.1 UDP-N-acetylmuramoylalanyl-D-glutamate--2,6-diaminopimelate ligase [Pseudoalteromonas denitrificans DSM 6059]